MLRMRPVLSHLVGAAALLISGLPIVAVAAEDCTSEWKQIREGMHQRTGCLSAEYGRYVSIAFDPTRYELALRGSGPDGQLPSEEDVPYDEGTTATDRFSLRSFLTSNSPLVAVVAGYPADEQVFVAAGLVRIDGNDVAERDVGQSFKSALLCLNDMSDVGHAGSRPIIFNAFENNTPIELNPSSALALRFRSPSLLRTHAGSQSGSWFALHRSHR